MYSKGWWVTFLLLCPHFVYGDSPKPADRWKSLANRNRANIIGDTPVVIANLLPQLADNGIKSGEATLSYAEDGKSLVVDQASTKLLGYWQNYNIGEGYAVRYIQPTADSVAVNIIQQESPSFILGALDCSASCWLINPNGVMFGEHARVNTRGLIAAAMELNNIPMVVDGELTAEFSERAIFSGVENGDPFLINAKDLAADVSNMPRIVVAQSTANDGQIAPRVVIKNGEYVYEPAPDGQTVDPIEQHLPRVLVKQGAQINSPGAPVLLAGPEVINEGDIRSDNGQIVLAASRSDIYLALTQPESNSLQGFIVEVDSGDRVDGYRGAVVNAGNLTANLGNVTLVAGEIVQAGHIKTSTAVDVNGSVRLLARDRAQVVTSKQIAAEDALYQNTWELSGLVPVGTEAGEVFLTPESTIVAEIDRKIDINKLLPKLNQISTNQRDRLFQLLNVADGGELVESANQGIISPDYAFDLAVANGIFQASDRFALVATAADSGARSTTALRSSGGLGDKAQPISKVHIEGRHVTFAEASAGGLGAQIIAPSAELTVRARVNPFADVGAFDDPKSDIASDASLTIGGGTVMDVSGTDDTVLAVDRNILTFFVTSNELRNAPEQKGGALLRQTVSVDIREGTPLFDWQVGFGAIQRSANERSVTGGTIDLFSSYTTAIADGVLLDASGGKVTYAAGNIASSRLAGVNGLVDIAKAQGDAVYSGVIDSVSTKVKDSKWGEMDAYRPGPTQLLTFRDAYSEGFNAGSIQIRSPKQDIGANSQFNLGAHVGAVQQLDSKTASMPAAGQLNITTRANTAVVGQDLTISDLPVAGDSLVLASGLLEGLDAASIRLVSDGIVTQEKTADLWFANGTSITLEGEGVVVEGDIRTIGGDVDLVQNQPRLGAGPLAGSLLVGGAIDTSGGWWNQSQATFNDDGQVNTHAGDIRLRAYDRLYLNETAQFTANGGALLSPANKLQIGKAGNVAFLATSGSGLAAELIVEGIPRISALDGASGGQFHLLANNLEFAAGETDLATNSVIGNDFFASVLAGSFVFEALHGNVTLSASTDIRIAPQSMLFDVDLAERASAADVQGVSQVWSPPDYLAPAGQISIAASRTGAEADKGVLRMVEGAAITANPGSMISLEARENMQVAGSLNAPGGEISLRLRDEKDQADELTTALNYIYVANSATLDASATAQYLPVNSATGETKARLFDGGSVAISADYGHAIIAGNANILLSGDLIQTRQLVQSGADSAARLQDVQVPLRAGQFTLAAERSFNLQAQVAFGDAEAGFGGGLLQFELDHWRKALVRIEIPSNKRPLEVVLSADETSDLFANFAFGEALSGDWLGKGVITQKNLAGNNLDRLLIDVDNTVSQVGSEVYFYSPIRLQSDVYLEAHSSLVLDTANLDLNGLQLSLNAAHVQLGESDSGRSYALGEISPLAAGSGELLVDAELVDFYGNIGINHGSLVGIRAQQGVRLRSVEYLDPLANIRRVEDPILARNQLMTVGDVHIAAPVLFAESLADYTFNLSGSDSRFEFGRFGNNDSVILSALGKFTLTGADQVYIDSRIALPFGEIDLQSGQRLELGANAQLDVSGVGVTVPLGRMANGISWSYPTVSPHARLEFDSVSGLEQMVDNKSVRLSAQQVIAADGSSIDVSAGGQFYAREFVQGLGGDVDVLGQMDYTQGFAILPNHTSGFAPFDYLEFFPLGTDRNTISWGSLLEVSGSKTIADGQYTLLPANYALLPGAYLITPESHPNLLTQDYHTTNEFGAEVLAGRLSTAGSSGLQAWQAYRVESGEDVARRAEYRLTYADDFAGFAGTSPGFRPAENGRFNLDVSGILDFNGRVVTELRSAIGVSLDITSGGRDIHVVKEVDDTAVDQLQITEELFAKIGANSILLGGTRYWQDNAWHAAADSASVSFDGVEFPATELMVVARDLISFDRSYLSATTKADGFGGNAWFLEAGGTGIGSGLLASSATGSHLQVAPGTRTGRFNSDLESSIEASSVLSVAYGAARNLGVLAFDVGASESKAQLQLYAETIELGSAADVPTNLLQQVDELVLDANLHIAFLDNLELNPINATFDTSAMQLTEQAQVKVQASESLTLRGKATADTALAGAIAAESDLILSGPNIYLSGGSDTGAAMHINAENAEFNAASAILVRGQLTLNAAGELTAATPLIAATDASQFHLVTQGDLNLDSLEQDASVDWTNFSPAPLFYFHSHQDLRVNTRIQARAGYLRLDSEHTLNLGGDAYFDLSPFVQADPQGGDRQSWAGVAELHSGENTAITDINAFIFGAAGHPVVDGELNLNVGGELTWASSAIEPQFARGLDLKLSVGTLSPEHTAMLASLNAGGFTDGFRVAVTAGDLNLGGAKLEAKDLQLRASGVLTSSGELRGIGGEQNLVLAGRQGVRLIDGASVELQSSNSNAALMIAATDGDLRLDSATRVQTSGDLQLVLMADNFAENTGLATAIASDDIHTNGSLDVYLASRFQQEDGLISNATLDQATTPALALIDQLWDSAGPSSQWQTLFGSVIPDRVMPYITLETPGDMVIQDDSGPVDLAGIRTAQGLPGILDLQAQGGISLQTGLSDGVDTVPMPSFVDFGSFENVSVLREDSSWSFTLASGLGSPDAAGTAITLYDNAFIRTGTGAIELYGAGDLVQQGNSYIGSFGQTQRAVDPLFVEYFGLDTPLAVVGNRSAFEYYYISADFGSGLSDSSGDVQVNLDGSLKGNSTGWTAAAYMMRLATDKPYLFTEDDAYHYDGIRAQWASLDLLKGGIHSVGGGSVFVDAGGAIDNTAFSTPGQFFKDLHDNSADSDVAGGKLSVSARGDILFSSFFNNGASVSIKSRQSLGHGDDGLMLLGSNFASDLVAGRDLVLESVTNSSVVPDYQNKRSLAPVDLADIYFDGFARSRVDAQSVAGNLVYAPDADGIAAYLPEQEFGKPDSPGLDMRYITLPSRVNLTALSGDLVLRENMVLFPDATANFNLFAAENINAVVDSRTIMVTIPDILATTLPNISATVTRKNWTGNAEEGELRPQTILSNNLTPTPLGIQLAGTHDSIANNDKGDAIIDRSLAEATRVTAAHGSISADPFLIFRLPKSISAYAGNDLVNTGFEIQHNSVADVSVVQAQNDILFPFVPEYFLQESGFKPAGGRYFRIDGPGDFILAAGNNIDLGTMNGIRSVGATENRLLNGLSPLGANVHVLAGVRNAGDYRSLAGGNGLDPNSVPVLVSLFKDDQTRQTASSEDWFAAYGNTIYRRLTAGGLAEYSSSFDSVALLAGSVSRATGIDYFTEYANRDVWQSFSAAEQVAVAARAMARALTDWQNLVAQGETEILKTRIAVSAMVDVALERPELFSDRGDILFKEPPLGQPGFTNQQERSASFAHYWSGVGQLLTLEYLLTPSRVQDLAAASGLDAQLVADLSRMSLDQQLQLASNTFDGLDRTRQQLIAEHILSKHMRQSSREGAEQGNSLVNFGRGYIAQRQFFGADYDTAIFNMRSKAEQIEAGTVADIEQLNLGYGDAVALASLDDVFNRWQADSGIDFAIADIGNLPRGGNISSILTTIQTSEAGGDITLLAPRGSVDVGISQSQIANIGLLRDAGDLGVIAKGFGNVNGIVADAFNVNESRTFTLAGGAVNLWSVYGDIDAGKGAKTILDSPLPSIQVSSSNGRILITRPPEVSGSGITSKESRSATDEILTAEQRFYAVSAGAGPIYLSTPLGKVDAGEAGIQSAGDLFIAASKVVGADNISVGGASVGVVADTSVSADVAAAGNSNNAATDAVQSSVTDKAANSMDDNVTTYVTVELLDTGTRRVHRDNPNSKKNNDDN